MGGLVRVINGGLVYLMEEGVLVGLVRKLWSWRGGVRHRGRKYGGKGKVNSGGVGLTGL